MNDVVIDTRTGRAGSYEEWVAAFADAWQRGRGALEDVMSLMSPHVKLSAPGLRSTRGREAGYRAFRRTFALLPDLVATVENWAAQGDVLFIEMTFTATIGGRLVQWKNVDRFIFRDGVAIERTAYFNPVWVRRAFLATPAGWLQLLRKTFGGL